MLRSKIFGIVPLRKGSIRLKNKNLKKIFSKRLIDYTIEAVTNSKYLNEAVITTDYESVIKTSKNNGTIKAIKRPKYLCTSKASIINVINHALTHIKKNHNILPENLILLQPTSPFRTSKDIDEAIKIFKESNKKSLISISTPLNSIDDQILIQNNKYEFLNKYIPKKFKNSKNYFIDGSIYIINTNYFLNKQILWDKNSILFKIKQSHSIDIDTNFDLELARSLAYYSKINSKIF